MSGPTAFLREVKDGVELGRQGLLSAGLYGASPLFKIMGAVELTSVEPVRSDGEYGDLSFLL